MGDAPEGTADERAAERACGEVPQHGREHRHDDADLQRGDEQHDAGLH
jgi:hypothetical protein